MTKNRELTLAQEKSTLTSKLAELEAQHAKTADTQNDLTAKLTKAEQDLATAKKEKVEASKKADELDSVQKKLAEAEKAREDAEKKAAALESELKGLKEPKEPEQPAAVNGVDEAAKAVTAAA